MKVQNSAMFVRGTLLSFCGNIIVECVDASSVMDALGM